MYVVLRQSGDIPVYVVRPESKESPQETLHRDLLLPCGFSPVNPEEGETDTAKAAKRPRTQQHPKNDSSDDGDESQFDPDEYPHDGYRKLRVETLGVDLTSETEGYLPERIEPELSKTMTAVEQDPSDVAKAFPEDTPVEACDLNLTDSKVNNLPDP